MAVSSKLHVLILDPVKEMRTFTKDVLKRMGLKNIEVLSNTTEAMKKIEENIELDDKYELLVLDYEQAGEQNGVQFAVSVLEKSGANAPKIVLTIPAPKPEIIKEAATSGIKQILVKPYTQQQLVEKLINLFDQKKKKKAA